MPLGFFQRSCTRAWCCWTWRFPIRKRQLLWVSRRNRWKRIGIDRIQCHTQIFQRFKINLTWTRFSDRREKLTWHFLGMRTKWNRFLSKKNKTCKWRSLIDRWDFFMEKINDEWNGTYKWWWRTRRCWIGLRDHSWFSVKFIEIELLSLTVMDRNAEWGGLDAAKKSAISTFRAKEPFDRQIKRTSDQHLLNWSHLHSRSVCYQWSNDRQWTIDHDDHWATKHLELQIQWHRISSNDKIVLCLSLSLGHQSLDFTVPHTLLG